MLSYQIFIFMSLLTSPIKPRAQEIKTCQALPRLSRTSHCRPAVSAVAPCLGGPIGCESPQLPFDFLPEVPAQLPAGQGGWLKWSSPEPLLSPLKIGNHLGDPPFGFVWKLGNLFHPLVHHHVPWYIEKGPFSGGYAAHFQTHPNIIYPHISPYYIPIAWWFSTPPWLSRPSQGPLPPPSAASVAAAGLWSCHSAAAAFPTPLETWFPPALGPGLGSLCSSYPERTLHPGHRPNRWVSINEDSWDSKIPWAFKMMRL